MTNYFVYCQINVFVIVVFILQKFRIRIKTKKHENFAICNRNRLISLKFIKIYWYSFKFIDVYLNSLKSTIICDETCVVQLYKHNRNFVATAKNLRKKFRYTISKTRKVSLHNIDEKFAKKISLHSTKNLRKKFRCTISTRNLRKICKKVDFQLIRQITKTTYVETATFSCVEL